MISGHLSRFDCSEMFLSVCASSAEEKYYYSVQKLLLLKKNPENYSLIVMYYSQSDSTVQKIVASSIKETA